MITEICLDTRTSSKYLLGTTVQYYVKQFTMKGAQYSVEYTRAIVIF